MAQLPCIGLYKPCINLPFGAFGDCAMYFDHGVDLANCQSYVWLFTYFVNLRWCPNNSAVIRTTYIPSQPLRNINIVGLCSVKEYAITRIQDHLSMASFRGGPN